MDYVVPFDQLGVANPGPWTNASPQAGLKGSIVNANVFPAVQQEILNVQDEAGLTRDGTNFAQLLQAIRSGKLTFFQDNGTADALVITPRTSFASLGAGLALSILKGQSPNATKTPQLSVGGLVQTIVKEDGSALAIGDLPGNCLFSVRSDGTNFRVVGLRRSDTVLTTYGATSQGGLAKDGSSNFLLNLDNLPVETGISDADKIALQTEEAEDGLASGVPFAATAGSLASYVLTKVIATNTFQQLVANPVLYVGGANASDNNSGTASAAPKATIASAFAAATNFNFATTSLTILLQAAASYALPAVIPALGGPVVIKGQVAGCVVTTAGSLAGGVLSFQNLTLQNTGSNSPTILSQSGAALTLNNVTVQLAGGGTSSGLATGPGGSIIINGGAIQGSGAYALSANGGVIYIGAQTITVAGSPTYSVFAFVGALGEIIAVGGGNFSGSASGQRYFVNGNGVIQTAGAGQNFFPGSTAGTTNSGDGKYY